MNNLRFLNKIGEISINTIGLSQFHVYLCLNKIKHLNPFQISKPIFSKEENNVNDI